MRDIKFRGKCIDGKGWMFGDLAQRDDQRAIVTGGHANLFEVEPSTVAQYTGLNDRAGAEIYEGDIIKISGDYKPGIYTVIWDSYRVAWWLKNVKQREREHEDDYYQLLDNTWQDREVIGNIHDNPEIVT